MSESTKIAECFRRVLSGEIDDFNAECDIEIIQKIVEVLESMNEAPKSDDPSIKKQMYCVICDSIAKE